MSGQHGARRRGVGVVSVFVISVVVIGLAVLLAVHGQDGRAAQRTANAPAGSTASASPGGAPRTTSRPRTTPTTPTTTPTPLPTATITQADGAQLPQHSVMTLSQLQAKAPGTTITERTVTIDRTERAYLVIAPVHRTGRLPMIVVLGGVNYPTTAEAGRDQLIPLAQQGKAVLVYPVAYQESWNDGGGCCGPAGRARINDTGFVRAVVVDAERHLAVDTDRAYLIGFSNGGRLAYTLQCNGSEQFAAVIVDAATPTTSCMTRTSGPPVPFLISIGSSDTHLPDDHHGRPATEELARTAQIWRTRNGCSGTATSTRTFGKATVTTYGTCSSGAVVTTAFWHGLIHRWPMTSLVGDPPGAALFWQFLSAHRR